MCFRLIKNILIGVPDPEERTATEVITNISTRITEVLPYVRQILLGAHLHSW